MPLTNMIYDFTVARISIISFINWYSKFSAKRNEFDKIYQLINPLSLKSISYD